MKRRLPLVIALAVVIVAALSLRFIAKGRSATNFLGSGVIEADEAQVGPKIGGRVAEILVREGDRVQSGQPIAVLEHQDLDADVERAKGAAEAAEFTLRDLERGSRPEQIAAGRARLAQAEASRRGAERQLRTARESFAKVTDMKQQMDAARARLASADANARAAKAKLDEARNGSTKQDLETLRAALRQAEARVQSARVAAKNADAVYAHQSTVEAPLIAASTDEAARQADSGLADKELARVSQMAEGDAETQRTLDQAGAQQKMALARLAGARRSVGDAREQVALTRAQASQARDAAHRALEEALSARDTAQAQLEALVAGTREERVRQAEAVWVAAQADAEGARTTLTNATQSYDDRLAARQQRDSAQAALDIALAQEQGARAELDLLLAGQTREAIAAARGRFAEAQAAARAATVRRGYADIVAPFTGTVTDVVAKLGEMINPGAPIVVLSDLDHMWLRAYLGFPYLGQVVLGRKMRVTTQAVPGRVFEGKVIRVSDQAEFTPKDVQTPDQRMKEVFWVKIGLGNGEGLLKPGMPADVVR